MVDQRDLMSSIYSMQDEIAEYQSRQRAICEEEKSPNVSDHDLDKLNIEYDDLTDLIVELNEDIAEYTEMLHKLEMNTAEITLCGFSCDGRCQTCNGGEYSSWDEVFTGGDY